MFDFTSLLAFLKELFAALVELVKKMGLELPQPEEE